jgi:hypothetical protein
MTGRAVEPQADGQSEIRHNDELGFTDQCRAGVYRLPSRSLIAEEAKVRAGDDYARWPRPKVAAVVRTILKMQPRHMQSVISLGRTAAPG